MLNKVKKDNKGFTIIEVLIVLAIAGLILLVVFLAVPALQRNSRNTQLKNGVSSVLAGVSEYVSNNDGKLPTEVTSDNGTVTITADGGTSSTAKINGGLTASSTDPNADIYVEFGKKCDDTTGSRNYRATYNIETSGDPSSQCTDG